MDGFFGLFQLCVLGNQWNVALRRSLIMEMVWSRGTAICSIIEYGISFWKCRKEFFQYLKEIGWDFLACVANTWDGYMSRENRIRIHTQMITICALDDLLFYRLVFPAKEARALLDALCVELGTG